MFPMSDSDVAALLQKKGPHLQRKDPPVVQEADLHVMIVPSDKQFCMDTSHPVRLYAITENYSYFPVSVEMTFRQVGNLVEFSGAAKQSAKVPPVSRDGKPGIKSRFVGIQPKKSAARGDVGAEWLLPKGGGQVLTDLLVEIETA